MANGRIVGGAVVLLVGFGLAACSSPQLMDKMRAHQAAFAKVASVKPLPADRHKAGAVKPPAVIPDAIKPAGKEEIPRAAGSDVRAAKPTIRF